MEQEGNAAFDEYKRKTLDFLIWKYTEVHGKWNTRHRSKAASKNSGTSGLRHDHVFTKKSLIKRLMNARSDEVDAVLADAIGCVVTIEEHARLSRFDESHAGWERYAAAGVEYEK